MKKISLRDFSIMVAFLFVLICNAVFATEKPVVWADDIDYTNDHVYYKNLETGEGRRVSWVDSLRYVRQLDDSLIIS
ncbi:hypothetical protein [Methanobacterium ferruginis]|uniref:hypothetical protein n=1 Tax=Methanobacterium ferruginis TaxID=710191 RepID=UPI0025722DF6|nr:hypothetical protein [Methanobacterium ferruginis]BDZ69407.1 hypothetical protein GCM10025860_28550 [Methanobacterium ferruginis]